MKTSNDMVTDVNYTKECPFKEPKAQVLTAAREAFMTRARLIQVSS
jgi:hypothetical protein